MADSDATPTDEILIAFDRGLLPEEEIDAVTRWLEGNSSGEERLRRLTEDRPDHAVEALRQPTQLEDLPRLAEFSSRVVSGILGQLESMTFLRRDDPASRPEAIRDYQLVKELGQGGMGHVYLARHKRLRRDVALKVLPARLAADPWYRGRFEREMAAVGQMDHPNLVRAHDAGLEGEHLFLAMELLDGQDLGKIVERHGPLMIADACEAVRQAALGLHHAHEHGVVHRDVKPGNLFLIRTGTVKVIDLGLARALSPELTAEKLSSVQTVLGTPDYMAPE